MRSRISIFLIVFLAGFFILTLPKQSFAGQCKARINFQAQPNPVPENGTVVFSGYVDMSESAWEAPGTPNEGYCLTVADAAAVKTVVVQFFGKILKTRAEEWLVQKEIKLEPLRTVAYGFSVTYKPVPRMKAGDNFTVTAKVYSLISGNWQQLTTSSPITINVTSSVYGNYYCVGPNAQGQDVYICDSKNDKNCANTSGCRDKSQCKALADNSLCGKPTSTSTHKACAGNNCVDLAGAGSDSCTVSPNSCIAGGGTGGVVPPPPGGGGPTTTQYTFNLPNPIGVTNFQDLINIIGKWIFNLAIPIAVIIIIYAGVLMLTSGGVPARFQKGAKALWYAVIGLAIVLIGKGFVTLIQSILSLRDR